MLTYIFVITIVICLSVFFLYDYAVDKLGITKTVIVYVTSYAIIFCTSILLAEAPTFHSEVVTNFEIAGSVNHIRTIYRDKTDGTYFYLEDSLFNPIKSYYRVPIDHDKMEQYFEICKNYESDVANLNLFE